MKRFTSIIAALGILAISVPSFAAFTAGMTQQAKNDMMTAAYVTGTPTIKMALGLQSANTSVGPSTTNYSSFTDLGTAHGYTTGGNTLSSCTVASTGGSSPLAADYNCTGGLQWTATDSTGITADCAVLYNSTSGKIIALYTFTSASATGNGATFTITPPTVAAGTRGMAYIQ
jgi:hypothetical protein